MTVFLILINVLVFLAVEFTGGTEDTMHMVQCGAAYTPMIADGEYYRLFTSMFLHFGPQHLGNNMLESEEIFCAFFWNLEAVISRCQQELQAQCSQ